MGDIRKKIIKNLFKLIDKKKNNSYNILACDFMHKFIRMNRLQPQNF